MFNTGILQTVLILLSSIFVIINASPAEEVGTELQQNLPCEIKQWAECKSFLQGNLSKDSVEYKQLQEPLDPLGHAFKGHTELIHVLLLNGLPVNKKYGRWEETMLHSAVKGGHDDLVALLLTHAADVQNKDYFHETPLHKAAGRYRTYTVKLLLNSGADVNSISVFNETPIFLAVYNFDAPPDKTNNNEETSQSADQYGNSRYANVNNTIDLLLEYGADVNVSNYEGNTLLHIAAEHNMLDMVRLLIERGANINAVNIKNETPLHYATKSNNVLVVKYLVTMGCDKTITNSDQKTALDIAQENKFTEVIDLLSK